MIKVVPDCPDGIWHSSQRCPLCWRAAINNQVTPMSENLQKVLARAGHGSRREMEALITAGRVSVDGRSPTGRSRRVNAVIRVDGHTSRPCRGEMICRVWRITSPKGRCVPVTIRKVVPRVRSSAQDGQCPLDRGRPSRRQYLRPVAVHHRTVNGQPPDAPSHEVEREYAVRVFGEITSHAARLRKGVQLEDGWPSSTRSNGRR